MSFSQLSIPAPGASSVQARLSPLPRSEEFSPSSWYYVPLRGPRDDGWWDLVFADLTLAEGTYEYEFLVSRGGRTIVATDPYAEELTRLSGYRAVLHLASGATIRPPFSWSDELNPEKPLRGNNELVIYELPLRWVDSGDGYARQVGLGTFDKAIFEHLDTAIANLKVNCIELLPVQDSMDTLNWGYGTRFFFAPDYLRARL